MAAGEAATANLNAGGAEHRYDKLDELTFPLGIRGWVWFWSFVCADRRACPVCVPARPRRSFLSCEHSHLAKRRQD